MVRGYYMAASGMLTQSKNLTTISNNLANISTPGYKADTLIPTTFEETLQTRTGNTEKGYTSLNADGSMIVVTDEISTDFSQGTIETTNRVHDNALRGDGFFRVATEAGDVFTRNGSFTLDTEGYVVLQHIGRVQGENGDILLGTDEFSVGIDGSIRLADGTLVDTFDIVSFEDNDGLVKTGEGVFINENTAEIESNAFVMQGAVERSNIASEDEMTGMLMSQRSIQSCSQILKMYDSLLDKTISQIGKV